MFTFADFLLAGVLVLFIAGGAWLLGQLLADKPHTPFAAVDNFLIAHALILNVIFRSVQIGAIVGMLGVILIGVESSVAQENAYAVSLGILIGLMIWWSWLAINGLVKFMDDYQHRDDPLGDSEVVQNPSPVAIKADHS